MKTLLSSCLLAILLLPSCQNEQPRPVDQGATLPLPGDIELGHGYVKRNGTIHYLGGGQTGVGENATRIDTPSEFTLKGFEDAGIKDVQTCEGLDVESFKPLSPTYSRDKNRVYFKLDSPGVFLVMVLPQADPSSFEVLAMTLARDKNHVWYYQEIQPGADPAHLRVLDDGSAFKDLDSVHYQYSTIKGADAKSFVHLASGYYRDSRRAYWGPDPVKQADPASFEVLGDSFLARDRNHVFRSGQILPGIDTASVELHLHHPAGYQIYSDKNGLYVNEKSFPRWKPGKVRVSDSLTVMTIDRVYLVDPYQGAPVTVFKDDGRVTAETFAYSQKGKAAGIISAEIRADRLGEVTTAPIEGGGPAPSIPAWQLDIFKRSDLVDRLIKAARLIQ